MAFVPSAFKQKLTEIEDKVAKGGLIDKAEWANAWADAYFVGYGSPTPPSATGAAARQALFGALMGAFDPVAPSATAMKSGVDSFALTLAGGMAAAGFAGLAPSGYTGISDISSGDKEKGAMPGKLTSITTPWFMSGTATHMSTGATVPWS